MNSPDLKQRLRQKMREQRRSLTSEARQLSAEKTCEVFKTWVTEDLFPMAIYLAFDGELNPQKVINYCWSQNYPIYLPIVIPDEPQLEFAAYTPHSQLVANQYGILQPQVENTVRADTLRTLLLPLTAFDETGARLGMGGGYYDRTLAACREKPNVVGLAYAFQQVSRCPSEAHDVPLDAVLTEDNFIKFG